MRRSIAIVAAAVAFIAGSCGSGDADRRVPRSDGGPITTTLAPVTDGASDGLAEQFWHSGFHVELTSTELWSSQTRFTNRTSYWLTLHGNFENLGDDVAAFDPEMSIETPAVTYWNRSGDPPRVLGGDAAAGELTFLVHGDIDLATADLVVGSADVNRARIPLSAGRDALRLSPTERPLGGGVSLELIDLNFSSVALRYDIPPVNRQLESGKQALSLYFDVVSRRDGSGKLSIDDFELTLPDGSVIVPDGADIGSLAGDPEGTVTSDRSIRFIVDEAPTGDFVLRFAPGDAFASDSGIAEAAYEFSL